VPTIKARRQPEQLKMTGSEGSLTIYPAFLMLHRATARLKAYEHAEGDVQQHKRAKLMKGRREAASRMMIDVPTLQDLPSKNLRDGAPG
jgi:hypothetical protein